MNVFYNNPVSMTESERRKISSFIEQKFGIKMPPAKRSLLISRLSKRLSVLGMRSFSDYFEYINSSEGMAGEMYVFIDLISTHETTFFREPQHYDVLLTKVLPKLTNEFGAGINRPLRILSAACSTGEEVYSIAIIISEFIKLNKYNNYQYFITGTDISLKVLETARRGVYEGRRIKNVSKQYRIGYFMRNKNKKIDLVRIIPELRSRTNFFPINLMDKNYPFQDDFDIILLKNALIYFDRDNQVEICNRMLEHLISGGYFFVGLSESMTGFGLPVKNIASAVFRKN